MNELVTLAIKARENAYTPYSGYNVGAALQTKSGKIYLGCNIENASFSPTVCAERVAFFKAISEGEREFEKIAVVGGKEKIEDFAPPCGVCRQVIAEFCPPDFEIILYNGKEEKVYKLKELLPLSFSL